MRESSQSPVPEAQRATFAPLTYFPMDPGVPGAGDAAAAPTAGPVVEMPTSTGQRRQMRRVGTLAFTLKGQPLSLGAFVEADEKDMRRLFVPFGDLTNGIGNLQRRPLPRSRADGDRASTTWISTAPIIRSVSSTPPTTAPIRRRRAGLKVPIRVGRSG